MADDVPSIWVKVPKECLLVPDYQEPTYKGIICPHGKRRRDYCADCGGSQICCHRKIKTVCRTCKES